MWPNSQITGDWRQRPNGSISIAKIALPPPWHLFPNTSRSQKLCLLALSLQTPTPIVMFQISQWNGSTTCRKLMFCGVPPPLNSWLRLRDIAPVGNTEWGPLVDLILPGPPVPPHWPTVVSDCEFFHEFFSLVGEPQTAELWWPALQANIGIDHNMETPNEMGKSFKFESYRILTMIYLCLFSNDTFCSFKISFILSTSG